MPSPAETAARIYHDAIEAGLGLDNCATISAAAILGQPVPAEFLEYFYFNDYDILYFAKLTWYVLAKLEPESAHLPYQPSSEPISIMLRALKDLSQPNPYMTFRGALLFTHHAEELPSGEYAGHVVAITDLPKQNKVTVIDTRLNGANGNMRMDYGAGRRIKQSPIHRRLSLHTIDEIADPYLDWNCVAFVSIPMAADKQMARSFGISLETYLDALDTLQSDFPDFEANAREHGLYLRLRDNPHAYYPNLSKTQLRRESRMWYVRSKNFKNSR